jgi:hypothetical protein
LKVAVEIGVVAPRGRAGLSAEIFFFVIQKHVELECRITKKAEDRRAGKIQSCLSGWAWDLSRF